MKLDLNLFGFVRCVDGVCYPCKILSQSTDYTQFFPKVEVEFTGNRPEFVIHSKILVNMDRVYFGS